MPKLKKKLTKQQKAIVLTDYLNTLYVTGQIPLSQYTHALWRIANCYGPIRLGTG